MELQRKITVKGCGWDKKSINAAFAAANLEDGGKLELVKVVGIVNKKQAGSTEMGEFVKLIGQFTAVNLQTGEQFMAPTCILSDQVAGPVAAALDEGNLEVQFGVKISARKQESAATGYAFAIEPLLEVKPSNAMQALLEKAGVTTAPALAAPETSAAAPAEAPAPAPAGKSKK